MVFMKYDWDYVKTYSKVFFIFYNNYFDEFFMMHQRWVDDEHESKQTTIVKHEYLGISVTFKSSTWSYHAMEFFTEDLHKMIFG